MYHIVYLTTNLVNQKIYVGVHSTYDLDDGYLGSGDVLIRAIKKYNRVSFKRDILYYCLSHTEAYEIEARIVSNDFIKRSDTYNIKSGGTGFSNMSGKTLEEVYGTERASRMRQISSTVNKGRPHVSKGKTYEEIYNIDDASDLRKSFGSPKEKHPLWGKGHTEESRKKIKDNHYDCSGSNNSRSKKWKLISPTKEEFIVTGTLHSFCDEHNISYSILYTNRSKGPYQSPKTTRNYGVKNNNTVGWELIEMDKT